MSNQLFEFQKTGVEFAVQKKKVLIADEMGLGKSAQAITAIKEMNVFPCLVIAPKAVIHNWKNEVEKWQAGNARILDSKFAYSQSVFDMADNDFKFWIINYDIVDRKQSELLKIPYKSIILDEIHYAKNYKAKRTKAIEQLLQRDYDSKIKQNPCIVIGLSGTPILNHGTEIQQIAKLIDPYCLGFSFFTFANRYCLKTNFGYELNIDKLPDLNERLKMIMIRRKKEEVLKDLPDKIRSDVELEIDDGRYHAELKQQVQDMKVNGMTPSQMIVGLMSRERRITGLLKAEKVVEFLLDKLSETNEKMVIFAHHTDVIKKISERLREEGHENSIYIGEMNDEQRRQALSDFENKNQVIIISMHAGGTGINLQFAHYVVFAELDWSPSQLQQAEDRTHRIGQVNNVTVYYLFAKNTMDEDITKLVLKKSLIINGIVDNAEIIAEEEKNNAYHALLRSL